MMDEKDQIIKEFMTVAINFILYIRSIYPPQIFKKTQVFNIPVRQSIHPQLNSYIAKLVDSIGQGSLYLLIKDNGVPIEKYTFKIKKMFGDIDSDLEAYLRAFLLKLSCLDATLGVIKPGLEWCVYVDQETLGFIECDQTEVGIEDGVIIPLKSFNTPALKMEMFVEESSNKAQY